MDTSSSDYYNEEEMTSSGNSANVYTSYNQYSNLNELEQESPNDDWVVSGKKKKPITKAQVFSSYVQSNDRHSINNNQTANKYNQQANHPRNDLTKKEPIKKPKLDAMPKEEVDEDLFNSLLSDFIGLQTFESSSKNIFTEFIENDIILVCLDSRKEFKSKFCFKGKCKFSLVYGQININGYNIKSPQLLDSESPKWFDLYSAETNSYLSISNSRITTTSSNQMDENQKEALIKQIILKCNIYIDDSAHMKLKDFINRNGFSTETTSLFALKILKSQTCDYLSYYENFRCIYQSEIGLAKQQDFDSKLAKIGIFPIDASNFSSIKIERVEEKQISQEILESNDEVNKKIPILMACGGKDVGKSTFLRYLVNCFLNNYPKVAYIDCDPGQCEFNLSGCIALKLINEPIFGPPHTHISHCSLKTDSCYFLGHLSPSDVPGHYLQCVRQCYQDYLDLKAKDENIPLIINTMGWNQGLGLCLLKESVLLFKPTYVVQINHPIEANKNMPTLDKNWLQTSDGWPSSIKKITTQTNELANVPDSSSNLMDVDSCSHINYKLILLKSHVAYKLAKFQSMKPVQKRFSPKDHRNFAVIAYFSNLQDPSKNFRPIHHLKPYKIMWSKLGLHITHSKVDYDQLFRVFNASLVGLCQVDAKYISKKRDYPDFLPGYLNSYDLQNCKHVLYKCLGFGIIRGINMETKEFYILTPDSVEILNRVNLLVKGMLNVPSEFFFEQDTENPSPYVALSDNMNQNNELDLNAVCSKPIQRKYLIHQSHSQQQQRIMKN